MRAEQKLASEVLALLRERGLLLATAESCTGGMIGQTLTSIPGSSQSYLGGVISYTNEVKSRLLQVPQQTLDTWGAVSEPVAKAMALGACQITGAQMAVSVTGLAGPDGDGSINPVGTVWIGLAWQSRAQAFHHLFSGSRDDIRRSACLAALEHIKTALSS